MNDKFKYLKQQLKELKEIEDVDDNIIKFLCTDYQTGLLNRMALYEYINYRFKGNFVKSMIIDIDNFKYINDTYGYLIGDKILKKVSDKLKQVCVNDLVFRFGGDEFIVISNYAMSKNVIEDKAKTILAEINSITHEEMKNEKINVSIGISLCKCNGKCCNKGHCKLISKSNIALYEAKKSGKNKYIIYTKGLENKRVLNHDIERGLNEAIKNDEIMLYYQPQYTSENKLYGFEALFRWKNKNYAHIPVIDIIKIMEKSNLILSIGKEIMRKACLFAKKINENRQKKLIVSFNVSSVQIMDDKFTDDIKRIIEETKVDATYIGIEITETVLIDNIEENIQKIKVVKELGIKISLDDFGTGYSSFNYLVKLPLSVVKIDRSFVVGMEESDEYKKLIKLLIDASRSLKLEIVAEGVEKEIQRTILNEMGVNYIQGYLLSKPLEENKALEVI